MIHAFSVPGGPGVRVDTFAHSECTVSPYYDSMIAKIIVHGRDRQEAIARMRRTLEMTVIEGIKTSIPLHLKILADPDFVAGRLQHRRSWSATSSRRSRRPASWPKPSRPTAARGPTLPCRPRSSIRSSTPTSAPARRRWTPSRSRRPVLAGGARAAAASRQATTRAGRFLALADGVVGAGARPVARRHRQRPRRHRARWRRRRRPRRPGRPAGRRRAALPRRRGDRRPVDAHRRPVDAALESAATTSPSGRSSGPPPRTPATTRAGSSWSLCRGARQAGRGDRRHHAGAGARACSTPARAVAVISDLLAGERPESRPRDRGAASPVGTRSPADRKNFARYNAPFQPA